MGVEADVDTLRLPPTSQDSYAWHQDNNNNNDNTPLPSPLREVNEMQEDVGRVFYTMRELISTGVHTTPDQVEGNNQDGQYPYLSFYLSLSRVHSLSLTPNRSNIAVIAYPKFCSRITSRIHLSQGGGCREGQQHPASERRELSACASGAQLESSLRYIVGV